MPPAWLAGIRSQRENNLVLSRTARNACVDARLDVKARRPWNGGDLDSFRRHVGKQRSGLWPRHSRQTTWGIIVVYDSLMEVSDKAASLRCTDIEIRSKFLNRTLTCEPKFGHDVQITSARSRSIQSTVCCSPWARVRYVLSRRKCTSVVHRGLPARG